MLTKEQILQADDLKQETVEVPEWGGSVIVRTISGTERDNFEIACAKDKNTTRKVIRGRLLALCLVDEDGKRLFSDSDAAALGEKSATALDRAFEVAARLNGIGEKDQKELEKNSEAVPADSISD